MPRSLLRTSRHASSSACERPLRQRMISPGSGTSRRSPHGTVRFPRSFACLSASGYFEWKVSTRRMSESDRASTTFAVTKPPSSRSSSLPLFARVFREVRQHAIQWCAALVVADADIGAAAHQERRRLDPAKTGGEVERRPAGRVAGIDLRPAAKEEPDAGSVPKAAAACSGVRPLASRTRTSAPRANRTSAMPGSVCAYPARTAASSRSSLGR